MCGFVGIWHRSANKTTEELAECIERMTGTLLHRGPDDGGVWLEPEAGLALGHRRLAVIDCTESGHQPMTSACGRYVLVFNGEVYNHALLRQTLEADEPRIWQGKSDTETLLAAIARWGMAGTLPRLVGMFAFAVYDRADHTLMLARDRLGEKPLYYGWQGDVFLFGSELKALRTHPAFAAPIDLNALDGFLRTGYLAAPRTIYQGLYKLQPGSWLKLDLTRAELRSQSYWSVRQAVEAGRAAPFAGSAAEAIERLDELLRQAISGQRVADVPVGAFLSGGYDSSAVVALLQDQSSTPVRTFTIGFPEDRYDESPYALAVARHLGTEHTTLRITPEDARAVIPYLPTWYDEPFADPSQIPTFLVSQLARQQVTVSLSGDGGDELFGGYDRYFRTRRLWALMRPWPLPIRSLVARAVTALPVKYWDRFMWGQQGGDRLHKLARLFPLATPSGLYAALNAHWPHSDSLVCGVAPSICHSVDGEPEDLEHAMMYQDLVHYLPDDILVKLDRAAMAVSLETRVPLLDHRIVEFAWQLPLSFKMHNGQGKWILRQLVHRHVPQALVDRPKMGFGIPLESWLRGPLREWAEALLDSGRLTREGYLEARPIRQRWEQHCSGQRNWSYSLWNVLMFQAWLEASRLPGSSNLP